MAKKTSKTKATDNVAEEATVQTIASKAAAKVAERIFKQNPDIKEAHVTADGTAFYGRNDAQNHANTLANREVFSFKRGASVTVKPAKPSTNPDVPAPETAPSEAVGDEDEIDELGSGDPINNESNETTNPGE